MNPRLLTVRGRPLGDGRLPAICAPLVARTPAALAQEAAQVAAKRPDLLEWRVDHLACIDDTDAVLAAAHALRAAAGDLPILFTRRARREGGEAIALAEPQVFALYDAVCASGLVDLVDTEMDNDPAQVVALRESARRAGVGLLLSFHDFEATPTPQVLRARLHQAQRMGADLAKLAVMPRRLQDVLALLEATLAAREELTIPVATMAMGPLGAVTRLCGGVFGSALTFAVGAAASAPGQVPIEDVRSVLAVLQRANG